MNLKQWGELLKYSSPDSIWIVTWENKLLELKCPFLIYVCYDIGDLKKGSNEKVTKVKISSSMITVFIVRDKAYYYYHFQIIISNPKL